MRRSVLALTLFAPVALVACGPTVPESGAGVGFNDYNSYNAQREASLTTGAPMVAAGAQPIMGGGVSGGAIGAAPTPAAPPSGSGFSPERIGAAIDGAAGAPAPTRTATGAPLSALPPLGAAGTDPAMAQPMGAASALPPVPQPGPIVRPVSCPPAPGMRPIWCNMRCPPIMPWASLPMTGLPCNCATRKRLVPLMDRRIRRKRPFWMRAARKRTARGLTPMAMALPAAGIRRHSATRCAEWPCPAGPRRISGHAATAPCPILW